MMEKKKEKNNLHAISDFITLSKPPVSSLGQIKEHLYN